MLMMKRDACWDKNAVFIFCMLKDTRIVNQVLWACFLFPISQICDLYMYLFTSYEIPGIQEQSLLELNSAKPHQQQRVISKYHIIPPISQSHRSLTSSVLKYNDVSVLNLMKSGLTNPIFATCLNNGQLCHFSCLLCISHHRPSLCLYFSHASTSRLWYVGSSLKL